LQGQSALKIYLPITALLATTSLGLAIFVGTFTSWDDLTEHSLTNPSLEKIESASSIIVGASPKRPKSGIG